MPSAERPEDLEVDETFRFIAPLLAGRRTVLDVGCGNGLLARRLGGAGFRVTALDRSLKSTHRSPGVRYVEANFNGFEDAPYDALVFSASLHHLSPLDQALQTGEQLLVPGGVLLAADFDLAAPDRETARWYYDIEGLLLAAGLFRLDKVGGEEIDDPLERWHAEHRPDFHRHRARGHAEQRNGAHPSSEHPQPTHDEAPLHTGQAMRDGLAARFTDVQSSTGPYLFRYLVGGLEATPQAMRVAVWVHQAEVHRIAADALRPVGLHLSARRPAAG